MLQVVTRISSHMSSFNRCPSCGFCIGKYADFFLLAKTALYKQEVFSSTSDFANIAVENLPIQRKAVPSMEKIFDALGIQNRCCRMRLFTNTNPDREYRC